MINEHFFIVDALKMHLAGLLKEQHGMYRWCDKPSDCLVTGSPPPQVLIGNRQTDESVHA